jgi:hypothetical protein
VNKKNVSMDLAVSLLADLTLLYLVPACRAVLSCVELCSQGAMIVPLSWLAPTTGTWLGRAM